MGALKDPLGVALISAGIATLGFIAGALAWRRLRWKAYATAYRLSGTLADRAETLHLWACQLPKRPARPSMRGDLRPPLHPQCRCTVVELKPTWTAVRWEEAVRQTTQKPLPKIEKWVPPRGCPACDAAIKALFREAGLGEEIEDPND